METKGAERSSGFAALVYVAVVLAAGLLPGSPRPRTSAPPCPASARSRSSLKRDRCAPVTRWFRLPSWLTGFGPFGRA